MLNFSTLLQVIGTAPAAISRTWVQALLQIQQNSRDFSWGWQLQSLEAAEAELAAAGGDIEVAIDRRREAAIARRQGAIAVVPVRGIIMPRPNILELIGIGTSVRTVVNRTRDALADSEVKAVVQAYDSPGGSAAGVPEGFDELIAMRGDKPIVAVAEHLMASGAYWLASAADEIAAAPSSLVGSIGVFMLHMDFSEMAANDGVKPTFIFAGARKVEGNQFEPLDDDARAHYQAIVDDAYRQFTGAVAKGRGVTPAAARGEAFGQGRMLTATNALEGGMVDKVRTLAQTLEAYGVQVAPEPSRARVAMERRRRQVAMMEQGI